MCIIPGFFLKKEKKNLMRLSHRREKAIKDLLFRSAARLDEWMTRGMIGSLKIPIAWVNEAKVMDPYIADVCLFVELTLS